MTMLYICQEKLSLLEVMMKKFVLVLIIVLLLCFFASCVSMKSGVVTEDMRIYSEVIESPGMKKDAIYVAANSWMTTVFKNANSVIDYSDKGEGKIVGAFDKYTYSGPMGLSSTRLRTRLVIEAKDDRYRITFSNPTWQWVGTAGDSDPKPIDREDWIKDMRLSWESLVASLRKFISEYKESDNW